METEQMITEANSANYSVIRFIQSPYINAETHAVVPKSWLWKGTSEFVLVSYPEENPEITRKRVANNETYGEHWNLFKAIVKYNYKTFSNAQNLATRFNDMERVRPYREMNHIISNTPGSPIASERRSINPTTSNTNKPQLSSQRSNNNNQKATKKTPCKRQLPEDTLAEVRALGKRTRISDPSLLSINASSLNEQQLQPSHQYFSNEISSNITKEQIQLGVNECQTLITNEEDNQTPSRRNNNNRAIPQEAMTKIMQLQEILENLDQNNYSDLQTKQLVENRTESGQSLSNQAFASTQANNGTSPSLHGVSVHGYRTLNVSQEQPQPCTSNQAYNLQYPKQGNTIVKKSVKQNTKRNILQGTVNNGTSHFTRLNEVFQTLQNSTNTTNNEEQPQPCTSNHAYNVQYPKPGNTIVKKRVKKQDTLQNILLNKDITKEAINYYIKDIITKEIKKLNRSPKKTTKKQGQQQ